MLKQIGLQINSKCVKICTYDTKALNCCLCLNQSGKLAAHKTTYLLTYLNFMRTCYDLRNGFVYVYFIIVCIVTCE